ncbi:MAG: GAF domain-containing protein [Anaerolineae bacterium]|nr:GAF domain-containing protein [Anaerolineae bacterium]
MPPKKEIYPSGSVLPDFEEMAQQLRETLKSLEDRAVSRTRDLEIAAQVSQEVSRNLDLDKLLPRLVNLTKSKFKLYHAHVYLLNEEDGMLIMEAGAGKAGKIMKNSKHSIPLDAPRSLVARAARTGEAVIINEVAKEEGFLPNPLLPDTKSEMAVPMVAGEKVIGVLDVQSDQINRFAEDDVHVMSTLAGQVAIAVENARAFTQVRKAQTESEVTLSRLTRQNRFSAGVSEFATALLNRGVMGLTDAIASLAQAVDASRVYIFANFTDTEEKLAARQTHEWVAKEIKPVGDRLLIYDTALPHWKEELLDGKPVAALRSKASTPEIDIMEESDAQSLLLIPISAGEKLSGLVGFDDCTRERVWEQAEIELLQTASTSIAYALTSEQLLEQTQSALSRVQTLYDASLALLMARDYKDLLEAFANSILSRDPCRADLFYVTNNEAGDPEWVELVATLHPFMEGQIGGLELGRYNVKDAPMARLLTADQDQITNIPDVAALHPLVSKRSRQMYLAAGIRSIAVIPLLSSKKQWIGIATFSWPEQHQLNSEDIELYRVLAPELATALENRQLVAQTREQAQMLRSIIDASPDWIFAKDKDYRYMVVNNAFAEAYGKRSPAEMIGKDDHTLGIPSHLIEGDPEKDIRSSRADEQAVLEKGETIFTHQDTVSYPDGTTHILETTRMPLKDVEGNVIGILGMAHDVTQQAAARRRQGAAYELAQRLATVLEPDELLRETVNRTAATFNYYHAHIYLYDPAEQTLVVREGLGDVGDILKEQGHSISLYAERSLVAEAARTLKPIVVQNVTENPHHLPNPLLPDTLSEVAVPLFIGEEMLGVFDVQHNAVGRFDEDEIVTLQIIANQLSVALSNARLFEDAQLFANEMATVAEIGTEASTNLNLTQLLENVCNLGKERLDLYHIHIYLLDPEQRDLRLAAGAGAAGQLMVEGGHAIPLTYEHSLVARAARSGEPTIVNDVTLEPHFLPNPLLPETRSEMTIPITLGMEIIGVLDVQDNKANRFTETDKNIHLTLANQIAVAISNARLFEETQRALNDIETLYMGSSKLVRASALDEVLQAIVSSSGLYQFERTTINFFDTLWTEEEKPTTLSVVAVWEQDEAATHVPVGSVYPLDQHPVFKLCEQHNSLTFEDVSTDERVDENTQDLFCEKHKIRGLLIFPIMSGDALLGVLMGESREPLAAREDMIRQIQVLTEQASAVILNIRLLEEAQATAEQLRELDTLKSEFLASMSHELRTPLNSIIGYSELMIDGIGEELDEMSREDLKSIHSSGQYLLALINDILDLAKIEAGRLELNKSKVDFKSLAPEILEASRVLLQEKPDLKLKMDIPEDLPYLDADPLRLRQVVWNLISNAIKFTSEGHIRLFCRQEKDHVLIGVEDTGTGIPPEHHETIFDRFRQVDGSSTRKAGGSGLGLAITRQLVWLHGGDMWLESEVGKGSTFILKLPLEAEPKTSDDAEQQSIDAKKTDSAKAEQTLETQPTEAVGD